MTGSVSVEGLIGGNELRNYRGVNRIRDWIDETVNIANTGAASDEGTGEIIGEIATTGSDRIEEILTMLRSAVMIMGSMDMRLSAIEATVAGIDRRLTPGRIKPTAAIPNPDALKITEPPIFRSTSTASSVSTPRNHERKESVPSIQEMPTEMVGMSHFPQNTPALSILSSLPTRGVTKSHSAIADGGYTTKASLWGACLASLLVACMRRYILKTGETLHVIDETVLMSTYREIMGDLYRKVKFTDLPAVNSPSASFMATTFMRPDRNTLTTSTAKALRMYVTNRLSGMDGVLALTTMIKTMKESEMIDERLYNSSRAVLTPLELSSCLSTRTDFSSNNTSP